MKKILKTTIFAFLLISLGSCVDDNNNPVAKANGFQLRTTLLVTPLDLKPENENDVVANLEWDNSDNNVEAGTANLTYRVEILESDSNSIIVQANAGSPINVTKDLRVYTLKVKELNSLINQLPNFKCGEQMSIDIRIKSTLGTGASAFSQYSNTIKANVSGYSTEKQILAFVKDGSLPLNSPQILSSSYDIEKDFQGYMYLEAGNYKFYKANLCRGFDGAKIYGVGFVSGSLLEGGENINIPTAGNYYITADLTTGGLKYSAQFYKAFGVFGLGVRNNPGSPNMIPMTADGNNNIWSITIDLFKGRVIKFKSNDWTAALDNLGGVRATDANTKLISTLGGVGNTANDDGELPLGDFGDKLPGKDIKVAGENDGTRQKYKITIDVSKPRNYTYKLELAP